MAALLELHPDREDFLKRLDQAGIPHVKVLALPDQKCGIQGTRMKVEIEGHEEEAHDVKPHECSHERGHDHINECSHEHDHTHEGSHEHAHAHMSMQEIMHIVDELHISEEVKTDVKNIYRMIAEAEGKVHGKDVEEVHFHEVGMMDAIADITGCAMLIRELKAEKIITSPVNTGFGQVRCAHGILPVPAPATALLLSGIPCYAGRIEGELCTPTGAAVLKYFSDEYGQMPRMAVEKIGYGLGKKDFEAANCVRAMLGETESDKDRIVELCCNLDDMTPEEIGYAEELLMKNGALDVFTTAIGMKKGRPGILLTVMCRPEQKDKMGELLFRHTTTIGIRETCHDRMVMKRREYVEKSKYGDIRVKECTGYGVTKRKPEYEDLKKIADETGKSLREIRENI